MTRPIARLTLNDSPLDFAALARIGEGDTWVVPDAAGLSQAGPTRLSTPC